MKEKKLDPIAPADSDPIAGIGLSAAIQRKAESILRDIFHGYIPQCVSFAPVIRMEIAANPDDSRDKHIIDIPLNTPVGCLRGEWGLCNLSGWLLEHNAEMLHSSIEPFVDDESGEFIPSLCNDFPGWEHILHPMWTDDDPESEHHSSTIAVFPYYTENDEDNSQ